MDVSGDEIQRLITRERPELIGEKEVTLDVFYALVNAAQKSTCAQKEESSEKAAQDGSAAPQKALENDTPTNPSAGPDENDTSGEEKASQKAEDTKEGEAKKSDGDAIDLARVMRECQIIRRERSPRRAKHENLSEMELLRLRADERAYQRSVKNVMPAGGYGNVAVGKELRAVSKSVGMAGHFVMAFIGAFLFGYFACGMFIVEEIATQALCGGMASFATLILESILFLIRDHKETMSEKRREREDRNEARQEKRRMRESTASTSRQISGVSRESVASVKSVEPAASKGKEDDQRGVEMATTSACGENEGETAEDTELRQRRR